MHDTNAGPVSRPTPVGSRGALKVLSLTFIVALVAATSYLAFRSERAGEGSFWLLAGGPVVALAPIALWRGWKDGELAAWMRPKAGDFTLGFLSAALLFLGAYAFSRLVTPNGSPRAIWLARLYLQLGDPSALRAHAMRLFAALIAVAAAEEIVWRGLVASLLAEVIGSRWAWAASAALYATAYLPTMWALAAPSGPNPILPIAALGAGLVWGGMARRFDRLTPGIVSHALFDWCVVVMFRLWGESL
jgi:membrane protease YdiL (CAAX protease family)